MAIVIGTEAFAKLGTIGSSSILLVFHLSGIFFSCYNFLPFASVFSFLELLVLTLKAVVLVLHPPECMGLTVAQMAFLFGVMMIGASGIRPCHLASMSDQFNRKMGRLLIGVAKVVVAAVKKLPETTLFNYFSSGSSTNARIAYSHWFRICGVVQLLVLSKVNGTSYFIDITILNSAVAKGAVCLDGSAPAYHFDKGSGAGMNNWLVNLEGGAWCQSEAGCKNRSSSRLGSSTYMNKTAEFTGILNNGSEFNPDFYNWNRVFVRYCDGSSYTGDVEEVNPSTNLHFRGARIFKAIVDELLDKGMKDADKVLLTGCSAGGLGVILNCDRFKAMVQSSRTTVKCLADAGYFINILDVSGHVRVETYSDQIVTLHGSAKNLPESCTSKMKPSLCFFPQYIADQIQTPIFFLNSGYDQYQIGNNYAPGSIGPPGFWQTCTFNLSKCTADQWKALQHFNVEFLNAFEEAAISTSGRGYFINSCYTHCQTILQETWLYKDFHTIKNTTIAKAVGDWVYDRRSFEEYGPAYPDDKTCHNL